MTTKERLVFVGLGLLFMASAAFALDANSVLGNPQLQQAAGGLSQGTSQVTEIVFGFIGTAFKALIGLMIMATGWTEARASLMLMGLLLLIVAWQAQNILNWVRSIGQYILIAVGFLLVLVALMGW